MTSSNPPSIKSVPFINGWHWIVTGFRMYRENPVMWVILFVIYFVIILPISAIPVIGFILSSLLAPIFAAGMMMGCRAMEQEQDLEINHIFAGFKKNTKQLVMLGGVLCGLYIVMMMLVAILLISTMDKEAIELLLRHQEINQPNSNITFLMLFLMLIVVMCYWFAPVLVGLSQLSAMSAVKTSFSACLKNILPLVAENLIFTLIVLLGLILKGFGVPDVILIIVGMFVLVPIMMTTLYASYADIFDHYHLVKLPENNA